MKYLNEKLSTSTRVEDLLGQMTLYEKVAQLCCILPTMLMGKIMPDPKLMAQHMPDGLGRITQFGTFAWESPDEIVKVANGIQAWVLENTRLKIPVLFQIEATNGLLAIESTIFPSPINLANTWDPEIVKKAADVVRKQMLAIGTRKALSPVFDLAQDPRWGRVDETFGEDPYLSAVIGGAYINGLQTDHLRYGVAACGKHFLGYSRSQGGLNEADVNLGDRDLYENFAFPFEAAIHEYDLKAIMCTYSSIDGIPASINSKFLRGLLRDRMGFKGNLICDGGSIEMVKTFHHAAESMLEAGVLALQAGLQANTPVSEAFTLLPEAVQQGKIEVGLIDEAVRSILSLKFELGLFENPFAQENAIQLSFRDDAQENLNLAYELAKKSLILLKNEKNLLPFTQPEKTIALIGPHMDNTLACIPGFTVPASLELYKGIIQPLTQESTENSTQKTSMGGISNAEEKILNHNELEKGDGFGNLMDYYYEMADKLQSMNPETFIHDHYQIITLKKAFENEAPKNTKFLYEKGCDITGDDQSGFAKAVNIAEKADVVFLAVGDRSSWVNGTAGECHDSTSLMLPGVQHELIKAIHATGTPIVLIIFGARPHTIVWEDEHIPAILDVWFPGQCGAKAIAKTIFGENNPSGHLPVSVPRSVGQVPIHYNHRIGSGYYDPFSGEDLVRAVGIAGYCNEPTTPLYHFGHGLSYTKFTFSDLVINPQEVPLTGSINISCKITNDGAWDGDEIVQLYTFDREAIVARPVKKLTGFQRVSLKKGETKKVDFMMDVSQLAFLDQDMELVVEPGNIDIMIGTSSREIMLSGSCKISGSSKLKIKKRVYFTKSKIN